MSFEKKCFKSRYKDFFVINWVLISGIDLLGSDLKCYIVEDSCIHDMYTDGYTNICMKMNLSFSTCLCMAVSWQSTGFYLPQEAVNCLHGE